jgi:hypothetical protein
MVSDFSVWKTLNPLCYIFITYMKKTEIKKFFLLSWKKLLLIIIASFISIVLHNLISGLLGIEEVFFFILVIFVIPAYTLLAILFSLFNLFGGKKK